MSSRRTLSKPTRMSSSAAYDASEEDFTDDTDNASVMSMPMAVNPPTPGLLGRSQVARKASANPALKGKHHLSHAITSEDDKGIEADVESPSTVTHSRPYTPDTTMSSTTVSTLTSPTSAFATLPSHLPHNHEIPALPTPLIERVPDTPPPIPPVVISEPTPAENARATFDPAKLTPEDIRQFVQDAINGAPTEKGVPREYKINPAPTDRPVRVYADGVYDLFHFGHALQLRQAKLSFPSVFLIVGCNSDEQVAQHKSKVVMTHAERCEAIRHCRWVDKIVPEAPWVLTQEFLDKYEIDYVAHDEDPYAGAGVADVYQTVKDLGRFIPTRRTPGVSTSELLERIVKKYRQRDFDSKLEKIGAAELKAAGSDYDDGSDSEGQRAGRSSSRRRVRDAIKDKVKEMVS